MDAVTFVSILTLLLTILASVAGAKYKQGKGKLEKISGVLADVVDAAKDGAVSEAEFQNMK